MEQHCPRKYKLQLLYQPPSLLNYLDLKVPNYPSVESAGFVLERVIGSGSSGKVWRGMEISTRKVFAIKEFEEFGEARELKDESMSKTIEISKGINLGLGGARKEIKILQFMSGKSVHVGRFDRAFRINKVVYLVQEMLEKCIEKMLNLGASQTSRLQLVKCWMYQLFKALDQIHQCGLIHCDVKPGNLVCDVDNKLIKVIDFSHAQYYWSGYDYDCGVGTVCFRSPELLFKCGKLVHYAVDVWADGCVFMRLLFPDRIDGFTTSSDYMQVERVLNRKFGTKQVKEFCSKYGIVCFNLTECFEQGCTWREFLNLELEPLSPSMECALDLLEKITRLEPNDRLTADEALTHPFFL